MARVLPTLAATAVALVLSAVVIAAAGANPIVAFSALLEGAFGSAEGLSEVAVKTCPLLLTGIAVALAFRAGIWNIGAEGQLLAGAAAMAWMGGAGSLPAWLAIPTGLAVSASAGALWAGGAAYLKVKRNVSEVIATIMMNFVAAGLVGYLVHGPLMEAAGQYPQTDAVGPALRLARLAPPARAHAGILIAIAAALACHVLLFRTVLGYQMRALGRGREAARLAGIRTGRLTFATLLVSGGLAGLAGGVEVSAVTYRLYERFSPGYGFTAIAVALLGRLHPAGVVLAALLFGALEAGSNAMQRAAGVSSVVVSVIQATVIFSLLGADRLSRGAKR